MDRTFYFQTRTAEHQREISRELATRNLLNHLKRETLTPKHARQLVVRAAPAVVVMAILLVTFLK